MTSDILTVTVHDGPGASIVLAAAGEIDSSSRDHLRHAAEQAISRGNHQLVLDLAAVTFCDSSGLSLLVDLHRQTTAHDGGWLRLAAVPPGLLGTLRVTNLDQLFDLYDTVEGTADQS